MFVPFRVCFRTISSTIALNDSLMKQAGILQRMLEKGMPKKRSGPKAPVLLSKGNIASAYENDNCSRRQIVLNKLYMEEIIPILTGGKYATELSELGIEVSKVQISKDMGYLNIYWITRKTDTPAAVLDKLLNESARELQQSIGSMRLLPRIPLVRFVKDERLQKELHLEKIFEMADYGPDYEPSYTRKAFTPTSVPKKSLPKMRQNVLGLDHAKIKQRIMATVFRHKAININPSVTADETESNNERAKYEAPEKLIPFSRKEFFKLYKRRRILALKNLKRGFYDS